MCNIAICDDELRIAETLKETVEALHCDKIRKIFLYTNGQTLFDDLSDGQVDASIIILDIKLGNCNGINLAEELLKAKPACQIIFVSGYDDYFEAVYDVEHVYFLQKPVKPDRLGKAISKALNELQKLNTERFCISNKSGDYAIPFNEIYTLEKDRRKIIIYTANGEICSFYGKFEEIENQLKGSFIRCHHSFMINLAKVKGLEKESFIMQNGRKIPISRTYIKTAKQGFIKYIDREY